MNRNAALAATVERETGSFVAESRRKGETKRWNLPL